LTRLLNSVHRDATRLTLRSTEIWTAEGRRREVKLLSAGHLSFTYQLKPRSGKSRGESQSDAEPPAQLAISVAAPAEASGFRWRTELSATVKATLRDAFNRIDAESTGPSAPITVPMDVTGQVRAGMQLRDRSMLATLSAGGYVMLPLGVVAFLALIIMAERVWRLHVRNRVGTSRLAERVLAAAQAGRYEEAQTLCRKRRSAQARVLAVCLDRRAQGQHAMEDAIQAQLMQEQPRLERWLSGLAVLAAVAPLLGLLGTVTGIIETFGVIRTMDSTSTSLMAGGISQALVTTATGLSLAIPILLIQSYLKGRADGILADSEKQAATLLNTLVYRET
jgi:biopolymer transport protein ExbB